MGRMSSRASPPEKRQLGSLSDRISELNKIDYKDAITILAELVPGLTSSLSTTGERLVHHEAYQGSGNLNVLAQIWMDIGYRCQQRRAPFNLRLQQYELKPEVERLYDATESDLEKFRFARFCCGFREFSLVCAHCIGRPWVVIPDRMGRTGTAMYVDEATYTRVWPGEKSKASSYGPDWSNGGEYKHWNKVTKEQLVDALARGIES